MKKLLMGSRCHGRGKRSGGSEAVEVTGGTDKVRTVRPLLQPCHQLRPVPRPGSKSYTLWMCMCAFHMSVSKRTRVRQYLGTGSSCMVLEWMPLACSSAFT